MKKLIINFLWTITLMAIGVVVIGLYMAKWVPSENIAVLTVWGYLGFFLGIGIFSFGFFYNYFVIAGINSLIKKF